MSRIGRKVLDSLRRLGLPQGRLPFDSKMWWDQRYRESSGALLEWGNLGYLDLEVHNWCREDESYLQLKLQGNLREAALADDDLAGKALRAGGKLLVLGGGTSSLSRDMASSGWRDVLDVDFSDQVVEFQNKASGATSGGEHGGGSAVLQERELLDRGFVGSVEEDNALLRFAVADAREMRPNGSEEDVCIGGPVDVCIDKGLVDALWCSGEPSARVDIPSVSASAAAMLAPGGSFLALSYTARSHLGPLLQGQPGSALSGLWARCEVRKLASINLFILERSSRPFREIGESASESGFNVASHNSVDYKSKTLGQVDWKKKKRKTRKGPGRGLNQLK